MALYLSLMLNGEDDLVSAASKAEMVRPARVKARPIMVWAGRSTLRAATRFIPG
ncbi:MAG: hypothetical protein JKP95_03185 [Oceanicaulis sp.]|nr:hypothetical protein [Oceanicaulis sp.]